MFRYSDEVDFSSLEGKTLKKVIHITEDQENEALVFVTDNNLVFCMTHIQDCCENVYIEDICGDLDDLIGSPLLLVEDVSQVAKDDEDQYDHQTWTFYKLATNKGAVTIRWLGSSNGYYSEGVSTYQIPTEAVQRFLENIGE